MADLQQVAAAMAHAKRVELLDTIYGYMLIGIPSVFGTAAIAMLGSAAHQAAREAGGAIKSGLAYFRQGGRMVDQHNAYRERKKRNAGEEAPDKPQPGGSPTRLEPNIDGMFKDKPSPKAAARPGGNKLVADGIGRGIGNAGASPLHAPGGGSRMKGVRVDASKFSRNEAHSVLDQVQAGGYVQMQGQDGEEKYYRKIHQDGVGERYIDATDFTAERGLKEEHEGRYDGMPVNTRADILDRAYHTGEKDKKE